MERLKTTDILPDEIRSSDPLRLLLNGVLIGPIWTQTSHFRIRQSKSSHIWLAH